MRLGQKVQALLRSIGCQRQGRVPSALTLDQVFGISARAVVDLVQVLRAGRGQRGDDGADIHAHGAGFDPGDNAALMLPARCAVAGLGK